MIQEVTEEKVKKKEEVNDKKAYIKYRKKKSIYDRMTR